MRPGFGAFPGGRASSISIYVVLKCGCCPDYTNIRETIPFFGIHLPFGVDIGSVTVQVLRNMYFHCSRLGPVYPSRAQVCRIARFNLTVEF